MLDCKNEEKINKILIVVGPSGVGKDTLMQKVFEKYPGFFKKGVTHTSRKMREGEKEGFNYYYVTKEEFLKLDADGCLVEHNFYNGNYYGLSKMELEKGLKDDKIMYAIIDINGAKSVHNLKIPANFIGILPPNEEVLEKARVGIRWCSYASTCDPDGKKWHYFMVADENIKEGNSLKYTLGLSESIGE